MQTARWETARALTTVASGGRGCNGWIRPEGMAPVSAPGSRQVLITDDVRPSLLTVGLHSFKRGKEKSDGKGGPSAGH